MQASTARVPRRQGGARSGSTSWKAGAPRVAGLLARGHSCRFAGVIAHTSTTPPGLSARGDCPESNVTSSRQQASVVRDDELSVHPQCGHPVPVGYGRVLSAVASAAVPARRGIRARRHRREALSAAARGQRRQCGVAPRPAVRTERPGCHGGRSASRGGDRVAAPHLRKGQQRAGAQGRSWSSSRAFCRVVDPRIIRKDGTSLALARVAGMPGTNLESGV